MEVATRAFDRLAEKKGDLLEATFSEIPEFKDAPLAKARQYLRLAALLHDVGHAAFSHAAEKVVHKDMGHEKLSVQVITRTDLLGGDIEALFLPEASGWVAYLIEGARELYPQLEVLHDIVSGEMDADRTDYLIRDSHHCGVDYGRFDYRRLIESQDVHIGDDGQLQVALSEDGRHALEALILARYQMNTQVYYHRVRRIFDLYLLRYHKALADEHAWTPDDILRNNDVTLTKQLFDDAETGEGDRHKWAERIIERRHHREVFQTQVDADAFDIRNAKQIMQELGNQFDGVEFLFDHAESSIHKQLRDGDRSEIGLNALCLMDSRGHPRYAGYASQILSTIPREFQCARIFADVDPLDEAKRFQMMTSADNMWQQRRTRR